MLIIKKVRLSLQQSIALGFFLIILLGAVLLMLPLSNRAGETLRFADALFTATSATCVTGLVIFDTYTQFTQFGQLVILTLIQIGGLGFMSVSIFFLIIMGRKINIMERRLLMESISTPQIGGAVRLVKRVLFITIACELLGAFLLSLRFIPRMGLTRGVYFGVFHAVSAFCNAGFDLMGFLKPYGSLASFRGDITVNLVVMLLIISGGIGFIVWDDVINNGLRFRRYKLHTKIVLSVTLVLLLLSAALLLSLTACSGEAAGGTRPGRFVPGGHAAHGRLFHRQHRKPQRGGHRVDHAADVHRRQPRLHRRRRQDFDFPGHPAVGHLLCPQPQ